MRYSPELYYFDKKDFPFEKSLRVIAGAVAKWCKSYEAKLIEPKKRVKNITKRGKLPSGQKKKEIFLDMIIDWISKNSEYGLSRYTNFVLFLYKDYPPSKKERERMKTSKFDHHDDTCCWVLDLKKKEFSELKQIWKMNGLPSDLFYQSGKGFCVRVSPKVEIRKEVTVESFKCYTPLQWKYRKHKNE